MFLFFVLLNYTRINKGEATTNVAKYATNVSAGGARSLHT
jgi:hypothetical protein